MKPKVRQVTLDTSEMNVLFVHSALDDYPLTPEDFRVYAHLARRADSGTAYPSIPSMARKCRMHPDTVRRCLQNLLKFRMLEAHERKGKTTLYTLTRFSRWVKPDVVEALQAQQSQAGAAKRAAKKAARNQHAQHPPETKGGVEVGEELLTPPERGEGYPPGMKGGHPSGTKGDEVNPLRGSIEGDPSSKRAAGNAVPTAGSDDEFSPDGLEAEVLEWPAGLEDGADLTVLGRDRIQLQGTELGTDLEQVLPAATGLAALVPISRAELDTRASRDMERHAPFRSLMCASSSTRLEYLRAELAGATRTGIPRNLLTRLTDEEIERVTVAAREEAAWSDISFAAAARKGLDRMIGELVGTTARSTAITMIQKGNTGAAAVVSEPGQARGWAVGDHVMYQGQVCSVTHVGSTKLNIDELESGIGHTVFAPDFTKLQRVNGDPGA